MNIGKRRPISDGHGRTSCVMCNSLQIPILANSIPCNFLSLQIKVYLSLHFPFLANSELCQNRPLSFHLPFLANSFPCKVRRPARTDAWTKACNTYSLQSKRNLRGLKLLNIFNALFLTLAIRRLNQRRIQNGSAWHAVYHENRKFATSASFHR